MPTYRNDNATRVTWGTTTWEAGESKAVDYFVPYVALGFSKTSDLPVVTNPVRLAQKVTLAAPSAAVAASAVLTTETGKTLTFTAGKIDHAAFDAGNAALAVQGNGLAVQVEANQADTLAVSNPIGTNVILVKLASTTGSKNTAALIEDGVQALEEVDGVDVSDLTVAGNAAYNAAPTIGNDVGTPASAVLDFGSSKTLTITSGNPGEWYDGLSVVVATADDDNLVVGEADGVITVEFATDTSAKNSAAAIQTLLRALNVEGLVMTSFTCNESAEYAAARAVPTKAVGVYELYSDPEGTTAIGKLTLTAGHGGALGEQVVRNATFAINDDDTLLCSYDAVNHRVRIYLADTTPGNNSAAAIQTQLRALSGTDLGEYLSLMTVTGDATWTGSPPVDFAAMTPLTAGRVTGADVTLAAVTTAGGDAEVVEETDFEGGTDGTTVTTVNLASVGKFDLSLVPASGSASAKLGDSTQEIPLGTSSEYQGRHTYRHCNRVTLTSIAAAVVDLIQEEAE